MRKILISAAAPLALLAACTDGTPGADGADAAAVDEDATLAEIHAAENAQLAALNAGDMAGATAVYADGATIYVPDEQPLSGQALQGYFERSTSDPAYAVTMDEGSNKQWVSAGGDLVVTQFTGSHTHTVDGAPKTDRLLNTTVWQKQADGSWKIASDVNMKLPDAGTAPDEEGAQPAMDMDRGNDIGRDIADPGNDIGR